LGETGESAATREEVADAAQLGLSELMINNMPNGMDTIVGFKGSFSRVANVKGWRLQELDFATRQFSYSTNQ
jgi:hypothetical protein